jgi:hypothetical protein
MAGQRLPLADRRGIAMRYVRPLPIRLSGLVALVFGVCLPNAQAGPVLTVTIQQGAGPVTTIVDNGPGDLNPAPNAIGFSTTVGDYAITGIVTSNNPGSAAQGLLQTTYNPTRVTANNSGLLTFTATQSNFTLPGAAGHVLGLDSTLAVSAFTLSNAGDSVTLQSFGDSATAGVETVVSPGGSVGPFFNNAPQVPFIRGGSYSLTAVSQVGLATGASVNFNTTTKTTDLGPVTVISEPSSALLFCALAPLMLLGRLRRCCVPATGV